MTSIMKKKEAAAISKRKTSVFANLSKGVTKAILLYKEKRWKHVYMKFWKVKKSARKKQVKCLIKVSEKIINYIKGPLDGQTDH